MADSFIRYIENSTSFFGKKPSEINSIKFHTNYDVPDIAYDELISDLLKNHVKTSEITKEITNSSSNRSWLISDVDDSAILVAHESGLEMLYVAGSVSSIIGLIALIINIWERLDKAHRRNKHNIRNFFDGVSIRQIDKEGGPNEEHILDLNLHLNKELARLRKRNMKLKKEINIIKNKKKVKHSKPA